MCQHPKYIYIHTTHIDGVLTFMFLFINNITVLKCQCVSTDTSQTRTVSKVSVLTLQTALKYTFLPIFVACSIAPAFIRATHASLKDLYPPL